MVGLTLGPQEPCAVAAAAGAAPKAAPATNAWRRETSLVPMVNLLISLDCVELAGGAVRRRMRGGSHLGLDEQAGLSPRPAPQPARVRLPVVDQAVVRGSVVGEGLGRCPDDVGDG